jgi:hypothetical protein
MKIDYQKQLNDLHTDYCNKVYDLAVKARTEIDKILQKRGFSVCCGMGTWVLSNAQGKTFYIEDLDKPPTDLVYIESIMDICIEGMHDHCFGCIM